MGAKRARSIPSDGPGDRRGDPCTADPLPSISGLTPRATVGDLPNHAVAVPDDTLGREVHEAFLRNPDLPGVIVTAKGQLKGVVSRTGFMDHLSRPFGQEIYLRRPIGHFFDPTPVPFLTLDAEERIDGAARRALSRPADQAREPVVVLFAEDRPRLVDIEVLLLALSQVFAQQNEENARLLREVRDYAGRLETTLDDLRRTQDDLVQARKMASLAQLVAGVAHEINTPIGIGLTAATHFERETEDAATALAAGGLKKSGLERYFGVSREAARLLVANLGRAAELIRGFKQVAVDQTNPERRTFVLRDYIESVLLSLQPRVKRVAGPVSLDCPEDLVMDSYPGALAQVLTNLVLNAVTHGFGDGAAEGRIAIVVRATTEGVEIRVEDNGRGIPADDLPRIFDPFFTTTRGSGGSGLGLHIVFNLVTRRLGGSIACDSAPGEGAVFRMALPAVAPSPPAEPEGPP